MTFFDTKIFITVNLFFCVVIFFFGEKIYSNLSSQLYIFLIPLIWPGLAHGSLDILTAKRKKIIKSLSSLLIFLMLYLLIPILFFFSWKIFPNFIFTIFLILSLIHFGISDKLNNEKLLVINEILLRSLVIICLPITFYNEQTLQIFYFLNVSSEYCEFLTEIFTYLSYFLIPLLILYVFQSFKKKEYGHIVDILILFFCFIFFQPLLSFFIYFCFLHSIRHLLNEKKLLHLTYKKLIFKTLPMTLIVLFFVIFFIFFYLYNPNTINYIFVSNLVIALFCLTVSHVLLINFIKD